MMRRIVLIVGLVGSVALAGGAFCQHECKTPVFITTSVPPNVLIVFDTSGSMRNVIWHAVFDPKSLYHLVDSAGAGDPLLPVGDPQVVFGSRADTGGESPDKVWRDGRSGRVILDYWKVKPGTTDIGDTIRMRSPNAAESDANGYFYFDRSKKTFITAGEFTQTDPGHVKVFLPYVNSGSHPSVSSGEYTAYDFNYLNWIFYRSTQDQRDEIKKFHDERQDRLTRILTAQSVIKAVVRNTSNVRFGVMRFNEDRGGLLIAPVGSDVETIWTEVDRQWAGGYTPLAETLADAWDHFRITGGGSPIQEWCQKSFVILITDGLPTRDADDLPTEMKKNWDLDRGGSLEASEEGVYPGEGSDYLDDIAYSIYQEDARPDLQQDQEIRNIRTFTIGLTTSSDLLLETAFNGNGAREHMAEWNDPDSPYYGRFYYLADNYDQLLEAIENALVEVSIANSSGTSVSVLSTSSSTEDLVFRASFTSERWIGFLQALELGDLRDVSQARVRWEAGELLRERDPGDRNVWTALKDPVDGRNRVKVEFTEAHAAFSAGGGDPLFKLLDAHDAAEGREIIRFVRGEDVTGFRQRDRYKLGDIVHSTPVVVGPPDGYFNDPRYVQFRREHASRERMLYVGANDGMLHAFYVDDPRGGEEAWAFIPTNLLGKLKDLTSKDYNACHEYFVDLTPTVADVLADFDGTGEQWRTLLIGGEREGGKAYFALDITEPGAEEFLTQWEFSDPRLGESWSVPAIERIRSAGKDRWLAFVGNGYDNEDGKGYLFAIDLESGENFADSPFDLGPESPPLPNVLVAPIAVDINGDDYADSLFAGDLYGRLWRVNLTDQEADLRTFGPLDPADWRPQTIFMAEDGQGKAQPITLPVGLSYYCTGPSTELCQNLFVYFGTGKYLSIEDKGDESLQTFYGVKDEFPGLTRDEMKDRTLSGSCEEVPDPDEIKGWYVDLITGPGERVSSQALVMGGLVFFLTFIPDDDVCNAGGTTWLYYREYDTGCVPDQTVFGEDPDPGEEGRPVGKILIGPGYAPELVYYAMTQDLLIQTSDTQIHRRKVTLRRAGIENYAWREVFY